MSRFVKATKEQAKARIAIFGPSGAGKTMSALRIARGMVGENGTIALIDSERGSAAKYADRFLFDTCSLDKKTVDEYQACIRDAQGYDCLIIDSLSHAWQELLAEIDVIKTNARHKGNSWSAWSEGRPKQKKLIELILDFPGHVIATMRSKMEYTQDKDERTGKSRPRAIGLQPEQDKGIEYEFDILLAMEQENNSCTVGKDRTGRFQERTIIKPGEDFGREVAAWLSDGEPPAPPKESDADRRKRLLGIIQTFCEGDEAAALAWGKSNLAGLEPDDQEAKVAEALAKYQADQDAAMNQEAAA